MEAHSERLQLVTSNSTSNNPDILQENNSLTFAAWQKIDLPKEKAGDSVSAFSLKGNFSTNADGYSSRTYALCSDGSLIMTASIDKDQYSDSASREAAKLVLEVWSLDGGEEPNLISHNSLSCSFLGQDRANAREPLESSKESVEGTKNPHPISLSTIIFSDSLRHVQIDSQIFAIDWSCELLSFKVVFDGSDATMLCQERPNAVGSSLFLARNIKPLESATGYRNDTFYPSYPRQDNRSDDDGMIFERTLSKVDSTDATSETSLQDQQSVTKEDNRNDDDSLNFERTLSKVDSTDATSETSLQDQQSVTKEDSISLASDSGSDGEQTCSTPTLIWCDRCHGEEFGTYFHCTECQGDNFDLCSHCRLKGNWCEDKKHLLAKRNCQKQYRQWENIGTIAFERVFFQSLSVLNVGTGNSECHALYSRRIGSSIETAPIRHPLEPLIFWVVDQDQLLIADQESESPIICQLRIASLKAQCVAVKLLFSADGRYLHVLAIEAQADDSVYIKPHESLSGQDPIRQSPTFICWSTFEVKKCQDPGFSFQLIWRRRFEWRGSKAISRGLLPEITVSGNEGYITFTDNDEAIKILRIQFCEPLLRQSRSDGLAQGIHGGIGNQVRSVSVANVCVHMACNLQDYAAQYFPRRGEGSYAYVCLRNVSGSGEAVLSKVCLRQLEDQDWSYMEKEEIDIPELVSTSHTISAYMGTTSLRSLSPERSTCTKSVEFWENHEVVPHKLCSVCEEICQKSHLLNNPLYWAVEGKNEGEKNGEGGTGGEDQDEIRQNKDGAFHARDIEKEGPIPDSGSEKSTMTAATNADRETSRHFEHFQHYGSIVELEMSYIKGCHLCSALLASIGGNHGADSRKRLRTALRNVLSARNTAVSAKTLTENLLKELQQSSCQPQITTRPEAVYENVVWLSSGSVRHLSPILHNEENQSINSLPQTPLFLRISARSPPSSSTGGVDIYQPSLGCKPELQGWVQVRRSQDTTDQDKLARNQFLRPVGHIAGFTLSTKSARTFDLAEMWINNCLRNHPVCSSFTELSFDPPTRVIDVGPPDGSEAPRIHISSNKDENMRYLTLSHCWGGADVVKLTRSSYNAFLSGFSLPQLPPTFQDAIHVTRRLNQRYLWIDSLCIIQDNTQDWQKEAQMMSTIYQNSICTIAASAADNSFGGCFVPRNPLAYQPCVLPGNLVLTTSPASQYIDFHPPLHSRAWVLQERLLCPRTLRFGSVGIGWDCQQCEASDQYPDGIPKDQLDISDSNLKEVFTDLQKPLQSDTASQDNIRRFSMGWQEIVRTYSKLKLTNPYDEFIAFAGIVERIQRSARFRYYYGLWSDPDNPKLFMLDLLWFTERFQSSIYPGCRVSATGIYTCRPRAPTFSWASVKGEIDYSVALHDRVVNESSRRCMTLHNGLMRMTDGKIHPITFKNKCTLIWGADPEKRPFSRKIELRSRLKVMVGSKQGNKSYWPHIGLEGPVREVELKPVPTKPGFHIWEYPFPESLDPNSEFETQDKCADGGDNNRTWTGPLDKGWHRLEWFFPDTHYHAHIHHKVLCLTIVRWQRDWDPSWYSAGLVLLENRRKEVQDDENPDRAKHCIRIGYFEHSWETEHKHWKNDGEVNLVIIS